MQGEVILKEGQKVFSLLFLIMIISFTLRAGVNSLHITDYKLDAGFHEADKSLSVKAQMKVSHLQGHHLDLLFTHFAKPGNAYVKAGKERSPVNLTWFAGDSVRLTMESKVHVSGTVVLVLEYSIPLDSVSGSIGFIYSLSRPERWYPLQYNDLSTHTVTVNVPSGFSALSTGDMLYKKVSGDRIITSWNDRYNFTCPLFIFRSDSLKLITKMSGKKTLNFFFYTRDTILRDSYIDIVSGAFRYFNDFFGNDYPYDTYSFIEIPDNPAGAAAGSMQVFGSTLMADFYTYGKLYALKPAVHEVAHEWWGIGRIHYKDKTRDKGLQFLRESVNEYLAYRFIEQYWGKDSLTKCLDLAKSYYKGYVNDSNERSLMDIPQQFTSWEEAVVVYYKGPLIVHELRKMLGDKQWDALIRKFYTSYKDKFATYDDFLQILAEFDKTGNIPQTLNTYLTTKGL